MATTLTVVASATAQVSDNPSSEAAERLHHRLSVLDDRLTVMTGSGFEGFNLQSSGIQRALLERCANVASECVGLLEAVEVPRPLRDAGDELRRQLNALDASLTFITGCGFESFETYASATREGYLGDCADLAAGCSELALTSWSQTA